MVARWPGRRENAFLRLRYRQLIGRPPGEKGWWNMAAAPTWRYRGSKGGVVSGCCRGVVRQCRAEQGQHHRHSGHWVGEVQRRRASSSLVRGIPGAAGISLLLSFWRWIPPSPRRSAAPVLPFSPLFPPLPFPFPFLCSSLLFFYCGGNSGRERNPGP